MAQIFFKKLQSLTPKNHFSTTTSILNPNSTSPLSAVQKSRAALSLLKSESNPERVLDICRAASLTPDFHLDRIAFSVAINKLKEQNYYQGIRDYLSELTTRPDLKNEKFLAHSIVLYGQSGLLDDAFKVFDEMPNLNVHRGVKSLNALLFACVVSGKYEEMKRVYVDFPRKYNIEPNVETFNTVIKGFCENGMASSGYSVVSEMYRKRIVPNGTTYGFLIAGFYKEEKFEEVDKVLKLMRKHGVSVGVSVYNVRIMSLCKLGRSGEARALMEGFKSRGIKPNVISYNHLIHGFGKEGNLEETKKLFGEMVGSGIKPDSDCYFTLVHFLCKGGDFEGALKVCKESMEKGWVPNFSVMKSLVNGLAGISKVDEARELASQMKEKFPGKADLWSEVEESLSK